MTVDTNRQWVLARRPRGELTRDCFELRTSPRPAPGAKEVLVRVHWLGIDPTQRGWLNAGPNYRSPIALGEVIRGAGVGEVVESDDPSLPAGTWVYGELGWQDYAVGTGGGLFGVNPVPPGIEPRMMLGLFGTTGLTAYFGMVDVGRPEAGDTVVVSAAAGATGSVAAQIARALGSRVIGIAGGERKCRWAVEVAGMDACIDHTSADVAAELARLAPDGIDVYFDNVGGVLLEAALANLALRARIVVCGGISSGYDGDDPARGPRNHLQIGLRRARMEGFVFLDHVDRFPEALGRLAAWSASGDIVLEESVAEGLEQAPSALAGLFHGRNLGKQLVRVQAAPTAP
ncbi:NADP-dependent oxidoreductase [Streptomyces sp. TRM S81-3]|uniref:NADP-dependent oxidoreductase n=1 Tax=Streptomyces griseicoloratus TaxID=2752516 RepID=A0A926QUT2_9ACTN|nr:NADP-dependent oxidoreductase [Streptomyces griseicoloratus]MBD0424496.1 NADP-dependent oxidoreductase [Streptomyces griseicoloratus]